MASNAPKVILMLTLLLVALNSSAIGENIVEKIKKDIGPGGEVKVGIYELASGDHLAGDRMGGSYSLRKSIYQMLRNRKKSVLVFPPIKGRGRNFLPFGNNEGGVLILQNQRAFLLATTAVPKSLKYRSGFAKYGVIFVIMDHRPDLMNEAKKVLRGLKGKQLD